MLRVSVLQWLCAIVLVPRPIVAPPEFHSPDFEPLAPTTPSFQVRIGGTLSLTADSTLRESSKVITRTWKVLVDYLNTATQVAQARDFQCLVGATELWPLYCRSQPERQCGTQLLADIPELTDDECWQECELRPDICRAMEYDRETKACWALPEAVLQWCMPVTVYTKIMRWRRPVFATDALDRIGVNITIEDDEGNATRAVELYRGMASSGDFDVLIGPADPTFHAGLRPILDEYSMMMMAHAAPAHLDPDEPPFDLSGYLLPFPDGARVEVTLVFKINYTTGIRFDAPNPLEAGLSTEVKVFFIQALGVQKLPNLLIRDMSVIARRGEDPSEDPNEAAAADGTVLLANEYYISFSVTGTATLLRRLLSRNAYSELCQGVFLDGIFGFEKFEPPTTAQERCKGPFLQSKMFSVHPPPESYFLSTLQMLVEKGVSTVMFASVGNSDDALYCDFGYRSALRLFEAQDVWYNHSAGGDVSALVKFALVQQPDAFIGCGDVEEMASLTWVLRAWSVNFGALVLMHANTAEYRKLVGAGSGLNVLSPVAALQGTDADELLGDTRAFFGTNGSIMQLYEAEYGEPATLQVALAAESLLGVMQAFETLGTINATLPRLQAAMLDQNLASTLGPLEWETTGNALNIQMHTAQNFALGEERPEDSAFMLERYTKLSVHTVSPADMVYPLDTWIGREASIYPCPAGEVLNSSSMATPEFQCQACPVGRSRNPGSMTCSSCGKGFYAHAEGLSQCRVCFSGMICTERGLPEVPTPAAGWYRLEEWQNGAAIEAYEAVKQDGYIFIKCPGDGLCLENNNCAGNNTGVLCTQCKEDYTSFNIFAGKCEECPSGIAPLLFFATALLLYVMMALTIVHVFSNTTDALYLSHSVTLRIFVDYTHLASATFLASQEAADIEGTTLELLIRTLKAPLHTQLIHHCVLRGMVDGLQTYQTSTILALLIVPIMLFLNILVAFVFGLFTRVAAPIAMGREMSATMDEERRSPQNVALDTPTTMSSPRRNRRGSRGTLGSEVGSLRSYDSYSMGNSNRELRKRWHRGHGRDNNMFKDVKEDFDEMWRVIRKPLDITKKHVVQKLAGAFVRSSIVWVYILLPATIQLLIESIACVGLDTYRLKSDLDVLCSDGDHEQWFHIAAFLLVFYGLGLPFLLVVQLWRLKKKPHEDKNHEGLNNPKTRESYGFLYIGFERKYYYFEAINMVRKTAVYTIAALPSMVVRCLALMILLFFFIIVHACLRPFDNRDFYALDRMQLFVLLAVLSPALSTLLNNQDALRDTNQTWLRDLVKQISTLTIIVLNLMVVLLLLKSLLRNLVTKKWILLDEINKLGPLRKKLLRLLEGARCPRVKMDKATHFLNCSDLNAKEKKFLVKTLKQALSVYMQVFAKKQKKLRSEDDSDEEAVFRPVLLTAAIRSAVKTCAKQRDRRDWKEMQHGTFWHHMLMRCGWVPASDNSEPTRSATAPTAPHFQKKLSDQELRAKSIPGLHEMENEWIVTVEELQVALMNMEPGIMNDRGKLHQLPKEAVPIETTHEDLKDSVDNVQAVMTRKGLGDRTETHSGSDLGDMDLPPVALPPTTLQASELGSPLLRRDLASPAEFSPSPWGRMGSSPAGGVGWGSQYGGSFEGTPREPASATFRRLPMTDAEAWASQRYWTQPSIAANVVVLNVESFNEVKAKAQGLIDELYEWTQREKEARDELHSLKKVWQYTDSQFAGLAQSETASPGLEQQQQQTTIASSFLQPTPSVAEATQAIPELVRDVALEKDLEERVKDQHGDEEAADEKNTAQTADRKWWQHMTVTARDLPALLGVNAVGMGPLSSVDSSSPRDPRAAEGATPVHAVGSSPVPSPETVMRGTAMRDTFPSLYSPPGRAAVATAAAAAGSSSTVHQPPSRPPVASDPAAGSSRMWPPQTEPTPAQSPSWLGNSLSDRKAWPPTAIQRASMQQHPGAEGAGYLARTMTPLASAQGDNGDVEMGWGRQFFANIFRT